MKNILIYLVIGFSLSFCQRLLGPSGELGESPDSPSSSSGYLVSYQSNSATAGTVPVDNVQYPAGSSVSVKWNPGGLAKTGFYYGGWNSLADGSGTLYTPGSTFSMPSSPLTLYAYWTTTPTYIIAFDSQWASAAASPPYKMVVSPSTTVGTLPSDPAKSGYFFSGWFTSPGGGGTQFLATTTVSANLTVYAYWIQVMLAASWDFPSGSELTDSTGNTNTLAKALGYTPTFTPLSGRNALFIAATTNQLTAGPSSYLNEITQGQTVSFWFFGNTFSQGSLISRYNASNQRVWTIGAQLASQMNVLDGTGYVGGSAFNYGSGFTASVWNHVVAVFDVVSASASIYVNGVLVNTKSLDASTLSRFSDSGMVYIGDNPDSGSLAGQAQTGYVASVKIYNYALSAAEVASLYATD